jgi:hypothetical protein
METVSVCVCRWALLDFKLLVLKLMQVVGYRREENLVRGQSS